MAAQPDDASERMRRASIFELKEEQQSLQQALSARRREPRFIELVLEKLSALVSAAIVYVAAIAWIQVAYGEIGLDSSEQRPIKGWDLVSFFCALVCVTFICFYGVYKLQKMKHRAVQRELEQMAALLRERDGSRAGSGSGGGSRAGDAEGDLLDSRIPEFSKLSAPAAVSGAPVDADDEEAAAASVYKQLVKAKLRAEGVQKGSNLITDGWTFANMKMLTIFLRSLFVEAPGPNPGWEELAMIWVYSAVLFVACAILVAAAWEYPPRFIAKSAKGFSTDRRARVELVAKNWSGGAAWLLGINLVDSFRFTLAQLLGKSWHPWSNPPGLPCPADCYTRGTSLTVPWLWLLSFVMFLLTSLALLAIDRADKLKARRLTLSAEITPVRSGRGGLCCLCALLRKRWDKVMDFIGRSLLWTGALALKGSIDETAELHGDVYRDGQHIPPIHDRAALGFVYAGVMVLAALLVGLFVDWREAYTLNMAIKAAEDQAAGKELTVKEKAWRARYEIVRRGAGMINKCLAYTSASQTSTAILVALEPFPDDHYWMYAFVSTVVGVLASVLLTNRCTLGPGGVTCKDCKRAMQLLCHDDCCCGGGGGGSRRSLREPLLPDASATAPEPEPAGRLSVNSAGSGASSYASAGSGGGGGMVADEVSALRAQNAALRDKLAARDEQIARLERRLGSE